MEKHSFIYTEPRTFGKYDAENIIGYLNEEIVPDYVPESGHEGDEEDTPEPTIGYKYTGTERDGGTVMPCKDVTSYNEVTNAIIRSQLSESEEMSIHRHYQNNPEKYAEEWHKYNELCENAKAQAKMWLGIG